MLFSSFRVVKTKFHHFWPPVEKRLEKSTSGPPGKIPSDAHAHKHGRNSFRRPTFSDGGT